MLLQQNLKTYLACKKNSRFHGAHMCRGNLFHLGPLGKPAYLSSGDTGSSHMSLLQRLARPWLLQLVDHMEAVALHASTECLNPRVHQTQAEISALHLFAFEPSFVGSDPSHR